MSKRVVQTFDLGTPWSTIDPFLFAVHHRDAYPRGNADLGPEASLEGREIGQDFATRDGWNMYHGATVPGFPQHPHRGFETITYVRAGYVDHADSLGATARYGPGDTQWLTAGAGIVHSEMFPLVDDEGDNPLELFQIWLNLPADSKMASPHFTMLWNERTPRLAIVDDAGRTTEVVVVAGSFEGHEPPAPPPASWASHAESEVAVWHIKLPADGTLALPAVAGAETQRALYVFEGGSVRIEGELVAVGHGAVVDASTPMSIAAGTEGSEVLVLQGRPIGEPVAQYGPFVMNDEAGIRQAFADYRETGFGGWPWERDDPVHAADEGRFARHADGHVERASEPTRR